MASEEAKVSAAGEASKPQEVQEAAPTPSPPPPQGFPQGQNPPSPAPSHCRFSLSLALPLSLVTLPSPSLLSLRCLAFTQAPPSSLSAQCLSSCGCLCPCVWVQAEPFSLLLSHAQLSPTHFIPLSFAPPLPPFPSWLTAAQPVRGCAAPREQVIAERQGVRQADVLNELREEGMEAPR